ncbi:MAG: hypothetical protein ABRQ25_16005 [Clostridiaceae bacterium]
MGYVSLAAKTIKLSRNFRKTRKEILEIREKRFRSLLKHAYYNSQFYHEYYRSFGVRDSDVEEISIEQLPCIDKKIFVENFDKIVMDKRITLADIEFFLSKDKNMNKKYLDEYTIIHSSGSTGKPTCFLYDSDAWETILAAGFRACRGYENIVKAVPQILRGLRILYVAATEGRFAGVMTVYEGVKGFGFKPLLLNINLPLEIWIEKINGFNPDVIIGYPSAIKIICDLISECRIKSNAFRVITGGEPLPMEQREYFQSVLGTDIFNVYAASESMILGFETQVYGGFYIFDEMNYLELKEDYTLITPLYNYSQPLIRYRLTDKLMNKEREASEALPFSKIKGVLGRNEEIMWFINDKGKKDFLHPLIIDSLELQGITKYQFVQNSDKSFVIRVELRKSTNFNDVKVKLREQMDKILKEKNLICLNYDVEYVNHIPINAATGKSNIVIKYN